MASARCFVGTSGWVYDWNPDGLQWYAERSGLNAVEVNATFYRLPPASMVESWARRGRRLRWAVKIHRRVSHVHRLNEKALAFWKRFRERLRPLDELVDFYLLQLPPSFRATETNVRRLRGFAREAGLRDRLAVEYRSLDWFEGPGLAVAQEEGFTVVSVDAPPPLGTRLWRSTGSVYLRLHGRTAWYMHDYSVAELSSLVEGVASLGGDRVYVFFNNDHWMLENAKAMMGILRSRLRCL